jgi:hypothetical protein
VIPELRSAYNTAFSEEKYAGYRQRLQELSGMEIPFRLAESPVFLPRDLLEEMLDASFEIYRQLSTPAALERSRAAVPERFRVPDCDELPLFASTDFAVVEEGGRLAPRLIELQAFPTLYAFQMVQSEELRWLCPGGETLEYLLSGLDKVGYHRLLGDAILGGHAPENVVLLDIDPATQKTAVDFAFTEEFWGVRAVCATRLEKRGRELFYDRNGKRTRILRIYNRLIFDELEAKGIRLPVPLTEPLDVEWAGHPDWYFRWSKHSLPTLSHPTVPRAFFLSDMPAPPQDLANWVLKPLYSFAGSGVKVDVTREDLAAVPAAERGNYLLMRKVAYAPALPTTDGNASKVEIRILFVWKDGRPVPVTTLSRLSQGKMMGVAFNKDRTWVGSSGCLWPRPPRS